jgi:hypothetical protein
MGTYRVEVNKVIHARLEDVYRVLSDMEEHRNILPKEFRSFEVMRGGKGEGTVIRITMQVLGKTVSNVMTVSEPVPGHVMKEEDEAAGLETIWTLTPAPNAAHCELKLESKFRSQPGIAGLLERLLAPPALRSIYLRELDLLDAYISR